MLIERQLEDKIATKLIEAINDSDIEIVTSWSPADVGKVKGETNVNSKAIVSIFILPRSHDSFSLPTVNVQGTIAIDVRAEQSPNMQLVSEIYEKILNLFDTWHYKANDFATFASSDDFYATALMLSGGDKVIYNRNNNTWTLSMSFTIKGNVLHN